MFNYLLTPLSQHYDLGFGSVANAFKEAADAILAAPKESRGFHHHLPVGFLYRHSIELYLKSAIIIFHKRLRLPHGGAVADEPHFKVGEKWQPLFRAHRIGQLYGYFRHLFAENAAFLEQSTRTDWSFPTDLDQWVADIDAYDRSSTYFRYPVTKDGIDDIKSTIREASYGAMVGHMEDQRQPVKAFLVFGEDDGLRRSFTYDDAFALSVVDTLRKGAQVFHDCHAALRGELTQGW